MQQMAANIDNSNIKSTFLFFFFILEQTLFMMLWICDAVKRQKHFQNFQSPSKTFMF